MSDPKMRTDLIYTMLPANAFYVYKSHPFPKGFLLLDIHIAAHPPLTLKSYLYAPNNNKSNNNKPMEHLPRALVKNQVVKELIDFDICFLLFSIIPQIWI